MQHVEVGIVFFFDAFTKLSLDHSIEVLISRPLNAIFFQKFDSFFEGDFDDWVLALKRSERILLVNSFQLISISHSQLFEHERQEFSEVFQDFEVVLLDGHFQIETNKLAHMTMGEGVFGSEHWGNLKDSLEVSHHTHLLVELG